MEATTASCCSVFNSASQTGTGAHLQAMKNSIERVGLKFAIPVPGSFARTTRRQRYTPCTYTTLCRSCSVFNSASQTGTGAHLQAMKNSIERGGRKFAILVAG